MGVFDGKSSSERNKLIAAIVLGVLAVGFLWYAFGPRFGGAGSATTASSSPTPRPGASPSPKELEAVKMPSSNEQLLEYQSTPVSYDPNMHGGGADPGRNIFAFYEPGPPCPECPTPTPKPTPIITPIPEPTPNLLLSYMTPQTVYAGAKGFRLELTGNEFTPDVRIYFHGQEMPTTFVSPQKIYTDISANSISSEGSRTVIAQTPDRKLWSAQVIMSVQPLPKPTFTYVGMIARKRYNNDTAYLMEQGKQTPTGYRLTDVVSGRFKLINISAERVTFEDINLGFKHTVELFRPPPGTATTVGPPGRGGFPQPGFPQPGFPQPGTTQGIPGIPDGVPRYTPPANNNVRPNVKRDSRDDEDDDTDNP